MRAEWSAEMGRLPTCKSFCGFQSESNSTTVSAEVSVMPRPPARVDRMKQKSSEPGALNAATDRTRSSDDV
jgi:hypothetical protein